MMFRTHRMFIILLCLIVFINPLKIFSLLNSESIFSVGFLLFMIIAIFGSMLPDIDNPSSKLGKNIKIFGYVFKHRGFFHSLPALLLFTWFFSKYFSPANTFAFFLGYTSHLIVDNLNYQGIYWLYPLKFRIKGFTKTKGLFEKAFFYANTFGVLILLVYLL